VVRADRFLDARGARPVNESSSEQQEYLARGDPSQRESKHARRRRVQPLDVVHCDQQPLPVAEELEHAAHCNAKRAMVDRITRRLFEEQRSLKRTAPRRRKAIQDVVEDVLEQISQSRVSETMLSLGRSRRQYAQSARARTLDAREPERRLADTRLSLEDERSGPSPHLVDESMDGGKLLFSADDPEHRALSSDRDRVVRKGNRRVVDRGHAELEPYLDSGVCKSTDRPPSLP
jgi:hypothetical protein